MWDVELAYIKDWLNEQDDETVAHIFDSLNVLRETGPSLGRPLVDSISGSRFKNMKELRPASPGDTEIRILFAFDPVRRAVMLLAGDTAKGKSGKLKWNGWYKQAIPKAEELYARHLESLE